VLTVTVAANASNQKPAASGNTGTGHTAPAQVSITTVRVAAKQTAGTIRQAVEELSRSAEAAIQGTNK